MCYTVLPWFAIENGAVMNILVTVFLDVDSNKIKGAELSGEQKAVVFDQSFMVIY